MLHIPFFTILEEALFNFLAPQVLIVDSHVEVPLSEAGENDIMHALKVLDAGELN